MKTKLALVIVVMLIFSYGCVSPFGLTYERECDAKERDSQKIECYHVAAVSMAYLTRNAERSAEICNRITEVGQRHVAEGISERYFDSFEDRAEAENNNCLFDVMKATARYDSRANSICCDNIQQRRYTDELFGAGVTQEMCEDQYQKQRELSTNTFEGDPNSICNFSFPLMILLSGLVFYVRKEK